MVDFKKLKKESGKFDKLNNAVAALNSSNSYNEDEDKFWKLETDKAGNGSAVFRFLPAPGEDGDDGLPWAKYFAHGFKGPTGTWLVSHCPTTLGEQCPVCDHNSELWNTGDEQKKKVASARKRKLNYVSNIYIVSDPKHPENNGTVKLFRYGKKIHDKILSAANPAFEDQAKFDAFDMWTGANFRLRAKSVEGYTNYDDSVFDTPGPLSSDDTKLEAIWKAEFSLKALIDPKKFPEYDELKKRLDKVLGTQGGSVAPKTVESAKPNVSKAKPVEDDAPWDTGSVATEDDDSMEYFQKLAAE